MVLVYFGILKDKRLLDKFLKFARKILLMLEKVINLLLMIERIVLDYLKSRV
jgi:hypothetical protein